MSDEPRYAGLTLDQLRARDWREPFPLFDSGATCGWCGEPATCRVPSVSGYTLADLNDERMFAAACDRHGAAIMARVEMPRELDPDWVEGRLWPVCHFCGKTLDNPAFGGPSRRFDGTFFGHPRIVFGHEDCGVAEGLTPAG